MGRAQALWRLVAIAFGALLIAPASASALSIASFSATPASTQAGGRTDFTLSLQFSNASDGVKDLTVQLPAGLVGDPHAADACTHAQFEAGSCPASAIVGTTAVSTSLGAGASGNVYVLEPHAGEPARLGIVVNPPQSSPIELEAPVSVRDTTDYGLDTRVSDIPQTIETLGVVPVPVTITGMSITLDANGAHGPFVTLPTACGAATTRVDVDAYNGTSDSASSTFTPSGCEHVPFTPTIATIPETTRADSPSGYAIRLDVPSAQTPIRQSYVSRAAITLPLGTALNPGGATGLTGCTDEQLGLGVHGPAACPAASQVGTATVVTPLLGPLTGRVYVGTPQPSALVRLLIDVPGPGFDLKLVSATALDPASGQVTATLANLPQLPFTRFELDLDGGPHAVLTTPPQCGAATTAASLTPASGGPVARPSSQFDVSADGSGTSCAQPQPFSPTLAASASPPTAGAAAAFTTTIARADQQQRLATAAVSLPPGVSGALAGIGICPLAAARAGACASDTRIGSATVEAGPGPAPLSLTGGVYLTGGFDGSLAGLAIVVPASVGPFDLGTVVTLAKVAVRPADAGLDVTTEPLPTILDGIPLDLRSLSLTLDRPGFVHNATDCSQLRVLATVSSTAGTTATPSAPYQATGCGSLAFTPALGATLEATGQAGKGAHPQLSIAVAQPPGQASSKRISTTLPATLVPDISRLGRACPAASAAAGTCPATAVVGSATAQTPLLPIPLAGPVLLVSPAGGGLPRLEIHFGAPIPLVLTATVTLAGGRMTSTLDGLPDVPLSSFQLSLAGGDQGLLENAADLCPAAAQSVDGAFVAHSGATASATAPVRVVGCPRLAHRRRPLPSATATLRGRGRHALLTISVRSAPGGPPLRAVALRLPHGLRLARGARVGLRVRGGAARIRHRGATLTVLRLPRAGAARLVLRMDGAALRIRRPLGRRLIVTTFDMRGGRLTFLVRLVVRR